MICSCVTNAVRNMMRGEMTENDSPEMSRFGSTMSKRPPRPSHGSGVYVHSVPNFSLLSENCGFIGALTLLYIPKMVPIRSTPSPQKACG